jgi:hypothetical protein
MRLRIGLDNFEMPYQYLTTEVAVSSKPGGSVKEKIN